MNLAVKNENDKQSLLVEIRYGQNGNSTATTNIKSNHFYSKVQFKPRNFSVKTLHFLQQVLLRCFCKHGIEQNLLASYSKGTLVLISNPHKKHLTSTLTGNPEAAMLANIRLSAANALCKIQIKKIIY